VEDSPSVIRLDQLQGYLDDYLRIGAEVADAPEALNGLQVANRGEITRFAAAVDLCEATIRMAAEDRADCLLVHHGLFWGGLRPLVGPAYRRLAGLIENNIALYSAHLPLDRHPVVGNNAVLARMLGVMAGGEFGSYHGAPIGVWGEVDQSRDDFTGTLATALRVTPRVFPFGPAQVRRVGIVTGSGGSLIGQAVAAGLDTFVTGEGQHWTYFDAEELGINVYYAGHYATETVGIKALGEHVAAQFGLPWVFLDHPTGL
jgi:dinuclear metal center YbgI/SA1388 family protein